MAKAFKERTKMLDEIGRVYFENSYFAEPDASDIIRRYGEDAVYDIVCRIDRGELEYDVFVFDAPAAVEDRLVRKYGEHSATYKCEFKVEGKKVKLVAKTFPLREVGMLTLYVSGQKYELYTKKFIPIVEEFFGVLSLALLKAEKVGIENAKEELINALLYPQNPNLLTSFMYEGYNDAEVSRIMDALGLTR